MVLCSHDQKVIQANGSLAKQDCRIAPGTLLSKNRPEMYLTEHRTMFEAFARRKGEEARVLMETHTNESMERNLPKLESPKGG
ncbi:MAG: hypothetical protein A3J94_02880 [Syntrophus sp. RIFOXYC2_FULL_54_9]|nr:MAG: hypothetical protein A2X92_07300 [Syntrophus sp. GWC2_56_31]OHE33408.1 MAG: hypothetical protein A3J94_02880 [Syntrophus sp. RIFOXYC2_FULL_54_9]